MRQVATRLRGSVWRHYAFVLSKADPQGEQRRGYYRLAEQIASPVRTGPFWNRTSMDPLRFLGVEATSRHARYRWRWSTGGGWQTRRGSVQTRTVAMTPVKEKEGAVSGGRLTSRLRQQGPRAQDLPGCWQKGAGRSRGRSKGGNSGRGQAAQAPRFGNRWPDPILSRTLPSGPGQDDGSATKPIPRRGTRHAAWFRAW